MTQPAAPPGMFQIPPAWGWPQRVKGAWVEGCVHHSGGLKGWTDGEAHAHTDGPSEGWICFRDQVGLLRADGEYEPSDLAIHHMVHLLTGPAHDLRWARVVKKWGGQVGEEVITQTVCPASSYRKV